VAIGFGIGMGLTIDEFALWLNLKDVYWSEKGRQSIDAAIITGALLAIALLGLQFWIDLYEAGLVLLGVGGTHLEGRETALVLVPVQVAGLLFTGACFLKGKLLTGIVGLFTPAVALIGALRLAKPGSPWARRYDGGKLDRSRRRFATEPA
jgi:hypothetical protein